MQKIQNTMFTIDKVQFSKHEKYEHRFDKYPRCFFNLNLL